MSGLTALAISPFSWGLLVLLGIALVVILRLRSQANSSRRRTAPVVDLADLSIRDARRGDMVTVRAAAPDFDDLTFEVAKIHRYESGADKWYELEGRSPHGMVFLEWYEDDGLQVGLVLGDKGLRLEEFQLTEADLIRMDEEQSSASTVSYNGATYHYERSGEIGFFEDGAGEGEGFYCWEFGARDGRTSLCVEKWEGEAFEALLSTSIVPSDVQIYRS